MLTLLNMIARGEGRRMGLVLKRSFPATARRLLHFCYYNGRLRRDELRERFFVYGLDVRGL